jgi:RecA-family ATPase
VATQPTDNPTGWLGAVIDEPGPALFFSAEEDSKEIHFRCNSILSYYERDFRDVPDLHIYCSDDFDSDGVLAAPDRHGIIQPTKLMLRLQQATYDLKPKLVCIEAAQNVYAGSENDRAQVVQFISMLRRAANRADAAFLLLAHPSLSGLNTGRGTSGNTGWNNAFRSRLYFRSTDENEDDDAADDVRELQVKKLNYAKRGERIRVRWQRGLWVPEGAFRNLNVAAAEAAVDHAYLACLDASRAQGREVCPKSGRSYAPAQFENMPQAGGIKSKAFAAAQERLFAVGKIVVKKVGPPSKTVEHIVRATDQ